LCSVFYRKNNREHWPNPSQSHILDVGCGSGRHAVELAQRGFQVTGIDISIGMLREDRYFHRYVEGSTKARQRGRCAGHVGAS